MYNLCLLIYTRAFNLLPLAHVVACYDPEMVLMIACVSLCVNYDTILHSSRAVLFAVCLGL